MTNIYFMALPVLFSIVGVADDVVDVVVVVFAVACCVVHREQASERSQ